MNNISEIISQGGATPWLFIPSAILLGALHGLEPGHSKTMMAAFIIAVRGTVAQAALLGLAATFSHTLVVWAVALGGMYFGSHYAGETSEPYFQVASGAIILFVALWMFWRMRDDAQHCGHDHSHPHNHDIEIVEETIGFSSAHERAHAQQIDSKFQGQKVTTGQIVMFGLTGGLIPCPAAITVLLLCLQLKKFTLGVTLVLCFSVGLAMTLVAAGTLAALGARHLEKHSSRFHDIARNAPYLSIVLITCIGLYVLWQGASALF